MRLKCTNKTSTAEGLNQEEIKIITSTIDLRENTVDRIMIKKNDIFKLSQHETLNEHLIKRIAKHGFSRIPIFDNDEFCVGVLLSKSLIDIDLSACKSIRNSRIKLIPPLVIASHTNLLEALSIMEQKKMSLALISENQESIGRLTRQSSLTFRNDKIIPSNSKQNISGLICLKDIFEKLVEKEFEDHDLHLQSMLSQTYMTPRGDAQTYKESGPKLVEMTEPEEYNTMKTKLLG